MERRFRVATCTNPVMPPFLPQTLLSGQVEQIQGHRQARPEHLCTKRVPATALSPKRANPSGRLSHGLGMSCTPVLDQSIARAWALTLRFCQTLTSALHLLWYGNHWLQILMRWTPPCERSWQGLQGHLRANWSPEP